MKKFSLISLFIFVTVTLTKANMQDSILIHLQCKIIEHGYFTFCKINNNGTINKITFGYSINLKKQTFAIDLVKSDTLLADKVDLYGFYKSDAWNQKIIESSVEKYYLVIHQDFLKWNNSQKLDYFMQICKEKQK